MKMLAVWNGSCGGIVTAAQSCPLVVKWHPGLIDFLFLAVVFSSLPILGGGGIPYRGWTEGCLLSLHPCTNDHLIKICFQYNPFKSCCLPRILAFSFFLSALPATISFCYSSSLGKFLVFSSTLVSSYLSSTSELNTAWVWIVDSPVSLCLIAW